MPTVLPDGDVYIDVFLKKGESMTAGQLAKWLCQVPDNYVIQFYDEGWGVIDKKKIRASPPDVEIIYYKEVKE